MYIFHHSAFYKIYSMHLLSKIKKKICFIFLGVQAIAKNIYVIRSERNLPQNPRSLARCRCSFQGYRTRTATSKTSWVDRSFSRGPPWNKQSSAGKSIQRTIPYLENSLEYLCFSQIFEFRAQRTKLNALLIYFFRTQGLLQKIIFLGPKNMLTENCPATIQFQ